MNTLDVDFCGFCAERITFALEVLENDNGYTNECAAFQDSKEKFSATLTQQQQKLYDFVAGGSFCLAQVKEKAIYKQGFTDALRLLAAL